jgi:hypothetical protein
MIRSFRVATGCVALCVASLLVSGCGNKSGITGKLTGKIVDKGQPYQPKQSGARLMPGEESLATIIFYPISADNQTVMADENEPMPGGVQGTVRADGTFEIHFGKNFLSPGKHRIVIKHMDPHTDSDLLKGKFNERNSKINRDIKAGDNITIDISSASG